MRRGVRMFFEALQNCVPSEVNCGFAIGSSTSYVAFRGGQVEQDSKKVSLLLNYVGVAVIGGNDVLEASSRLEPTPCPKHIRGAIKFVENVANNVSSEMACHA